METAAASGAWGVLKTTAIQPGAFVPKHNKALPEGLEPRPDIVVEAGDLLLTCAGPRSRCGVPCLVRHTPPRLMMSGKMYRFRVRADLAAPAFVEAQLLAQPWQAAIDEMKTGISDSGLNLTHGRFRKLPIHLPSLAEQHRIVAEVEKQFTRLDDAVVTLEQVKSKLKRARASVLKAAVEGRLVPTEAALARAEGRDYEPAAVLLQRILAERKRKHEEDQAASGRHAKYAPPTEPDTGSLPVLPEGWVWATVGSAVVHGPTNGLYVPARQYGSGVHILRIADFQDGWSRAASELQQVRIDTDTEAAFRLALGDLVVNRVNSMTHLGKSMVVAKRHVPAVFESNMMRIRPTHLVSVDFLDCWLRSATGRKFLTKNAKWAVNQASINQSDVCATPVPLPPLAEQHRIVSEVERRLSVLDAAEQAVERNLARCAHLRQSILKRAFEGRLVPQDHHDEPAAALLARIQNQPPIPSRPPPNE